MIYLIIGAAILALLLIGGLALAIHEMGAREALFVVGGSIALSAVIIAGAGAFTYGLNELGWLQ
ncbi:hypothetical protein CH289_07780 [Rhodococcus sp. RS1C4]|nr:hypothetical protein [Rhodococcus sp. RS1C4]OZC55083.1 hypothetical protein CH289_07780 [Rhodococcus sp. RS1C4]